MLYNFRSSSYSHNPYGSKVVTCRKAFPIFHNECVQVYSILKIYTHVCISISYLMPIISLICTNGSEMLKFSVPVHVDAHIVYVNMY